jgi:hypothetical protein
VTASSLAAAAPYQASDTASATAAAANPELVGQLSKELGVSTDKAAGAAGSLFGIAKSKLKPEEFSQIASAVPGMESLLKAVPTQTASATGTAGALSQLAGSAAGSMGAAASAFSKLGLSPEMVSKAASVLSSYVSKSGGASVASLLTGALK